METDLSALLRSIPNTLKPLLSNSDATERPIPELAPVTIYEFIIYEFESVLNTYGVG